MLRQSSSSGRVSGKVTTRLSFLRPKRGEALRFASRIRLFNVTAVELGAVLWALTFGGEPDKYRHMIGRAKPFGAGQAHVAAAKLCIEPNVTASPLIKTAAGANWDKLAPCDDADHKPFLAAFETHMEKNAPGWRASKTISEFLKASDPAVGAALADKGKLTYLTLGKPNPYHLLRDMTKPRKDGRPPIGPERFLEFE